MLISLLLYPWCSACLVLLSQASVLESSEAAGEQLPRAKREVSCAEKFQIIKGHTACLPGSSSSVVSKADQKVIVDKHNEFRAAVNPPAANMLKLRWDEEVAMLAQKWADRCVFKHDGNDQRMIPGRFPHVGQNLAIGTSDWTSAITLFHDEVKDFRYGDPSYDLYKIGHYTAIVWANTTLVGCGEAVCGRQKLQVCNYAPGSASTLTGHSRYTTSVGPFTGGGFQMGASKPAHNVYAPNKITMLSRGNLQSLIPTPYRQGPPCQDCPNHCVGGKLCDCNLTCLNGGELDLATCQCKCPSQSTFFNQPTCFLNCTGAEDVKWMCKLDSASCPFYSGWCPNKCSFCPSAGYGYAVAGHGNAEQGKSGGETAMTSRVAHRYVLLVLVLLLKPLTL